MEKAQFDNVFIILVDLILVQKKDYGLKVGLAEEDNGIQEDEKKEHILDKLNQKDYFID